MFESQSDDVLGVSGVQFPPRVGFREFDVLVRVLWSVNAFVPVGAFTFLLLAKGA
jgi:hypothetical protein